MTVFVRLLEAGVVGFGVFCAAYVVLWVVLLGGEYPKP